MQGDHRQYKVVLSEASYKKIEDYKEKIQSNTLNAGTRLQKQLNGKNISDFSINQFIELLLNTKEPQIFAESEDLSAWNEAEQAILGDIGITMPVKIFDNGVWHGSDIKLHAQPLNGFLLFTPGPLLTQENFPDYKEVVENGEIKQEKYNALIERRLLPLFVQANENAQALEHKAIVTLPDIGCGYFAGNFISSIKNNFNIAIKNILTKYAFNNIALVQRQGGENTSDDINGVKYRNRNTCGGLLNAPNFWKQHDDDFSACKIYKFVAWDHFSWPGNDFFGGSRHTDDGVSAAATNSMEVLTGIKGRYDENSKMYLDDKGSAQWNSSITDEIRLSASDNNILIVNSEGKFVTGENLLNNCILKGPTNELNREQVVRALHRLYTWNNRDTDRFVESVVKIYNDAINELADDIKEELKGKVKAELLKYNSEIDKLNIFMRVWNFVKELFGYGLAAKFSHNIYTSMERPLTKNNSQDSINGVSL